MKRTVKIPDLLKTARDFLPDIIAVELVKRDYGLSLRLRWKNFPKTIYSDHWIMSYTKSRLDPEAYQIIMERTKNEMKEAITKFGKNECDLLLDKFKLSEVYKKLYEDRNIMYKVKHDYKREINGARITKNLDFYYYDEIKISFPNLFHLWILITKKKFVHNNMEGLFDIVHSVIEHIKQLYFTYDIIKNIITEAEHYGNPDTFFVFYYHFTYFISLVKTIGDNLAWILKLYLNLNVSRHSMIDLTSEGFKTIVQSRRHYYNILYSDDYYKEYRKLSEFRDIIQHRHVIKSMRVIVGTSRKNKILIPKDPERFIADPLKIQKNNSSATRVNIAANLDSVIAFGLHESILVSDDDAVRDYVDPTVYCEKHINGISLVINRIASRVIGEATRQLVGLVTNFYSKKKVAVVNINDELKVGDQILVESKETSFQQEVISMEINHKKVEKCEKGLAAINVNERVRVNDKIYTVKKFEKSAVVRSILGR